MMKTGIKVALLGAVVGGALAWGILGAPIAQDEDYHRFADTRSLFGVPNAADTLSNLAFLVVGIVGLAFLVREERSEQSLRFASREERLPYWFFFAAVAATAFGSGCYHLAPDDARLTLDRAPMAVAFMALVAALVSERVNARAGVILLAPLMVLGMASVAWWRLSATAGAENLRPYLAVQFGAVAVALLLSFYRSRYSAGGWFFAVLGLYLAAKILEAEDREVYGRLGWASGHTLKHLAAAAAAGVVLLGVWRRRLRY